MQNTQSQKADSVSETKNQSPSKYIYAQAAKRSAESSQPPTTLMCQPPCWHLKHLHTAQTRFHCRQASLGSDSPLYNGRFWLKTGVSGLARAAKAAAPAMQALQSCRMA